MFFLVNFATGRNYKGMNAPILFYRRLATPYWLLWAGMTKFQIASDTIKVNDTVFNELVVALSKRLVGFGGASLSAISLHVGWQVNPKIK